MLAGVRPPMGPVGDRDYNVLAERFFATLKCELLDRATFRTLADAHTAVFGYLKGWYSPHRRNSALDYHSPINCERQHARQAAEPKPEPVH